MSNREPDSSRGGVLSRRSLTSSAAALAVGGTLHRPAHAQETRNTQGTSPYYPPVKAGIEPSGAKVAPYTAACVQSPVVPTFDDAGAFVPDALAHNVEVMCDLIERGAGEHGARLMSFPEFGLQIPGSFAITPAQWYEGTIRADGPELERIGKACQNANAFVAFNPAEGFDQYPGRYFLSGMIVGPSGDLILNCRKLTGLTSKTRPGDILSEWIDTFGEDSLFPVADTEIGRLTCVVAGDMNYPEVARAMVLKGAEALLSPTASIPLPKGHDFSMPSVSDMTRRVRAFENTAYVLLSNLGPMAPAFGQEAESPYPRRQPSQIIDFKGALVAQSETGDVEITTAALDIDALRQQRTSLGSFNTMINHMQMPLFRHMYDGVEGAPVDTHLDGPMLSATELADIQRDTIARMVAQGALVAPGV